MTLQSDAAITLTDVASPAAERSEIHTMEQDGDVMRMRALETLEIPAGQVVQLTPSGTHIMLMNLHEPLVEGDHIMLTLQGRTADGEAVSQTVHIPVLALSAHGAGHEHMHEHATQKHGH